MTHMTPLITGVDFVCIPAQDFDAMTAFYGETLDLPFVKRYGDHPGAEYQAGNLTLAIMRTEDFGGTFSPNAMPIALQVVDVAVARQRLEAHGVRFVGDTFDSGVCWQAICLDPDGNPLSLRQLCAEGRTARRGVAGPQSARHPVLATCTCETGPLAETRCERQAGNSRVRPARGKPGRQVARSRRRTAADVASCEIGEERVGVRMRVETRFASERSLGGGDEAVIAAARSALPLR